MSTTDTLLSVEDLHVHYGKSHVLHGVETFVRHMSKEVVLPLGEIQNMLQCANVALGTIWPFHTATMMGGLGELYHDLVCIAGEID